jgi:thiol-disulfide isomerase/thioredoxin
MTRSVIPWMCLVLAMTVVGCTKSTPPKSPKAPETGPQATTTPETPKKDTTAATTPPAKETTPPAKEEEKPTTPETKPGTETTPDNAATQPDMKQPADVTPPAKKLPFEDLVAALGNDRANEAYRQIEETLAKNPQDVMSRLQLASLLNAVGMNLASTGNREKASEAFLAAMDQVKAVPVESLPPGADRLVNVVYYNGACAQSLGGKPEDAKASLQKAIETGYSDLESLRNDADLAAVRALPDFDQQMTAWGTLIAERVTKEAQEMLASGETFPFDFSLTDLNGQAISRAAFAGKVLIVDIWGTWCPPCRAEIPSFVRLQSEYGPQGLQIVGLNYENSAGSEDAVKETIKKFMDENKMNYPCAIGTEDIQKQVPEFEGFPTTIFIDRTGKVRAKVVGMHEYSLLEALVKTLLAEPAPPAEPAKEQPAPPAEPAKEPAPPAEPAKEQPAPPAEPAKEPAPPAEPTKEQPPADTPAPADKPPADAPAPAEPGK